MAAKINLAALLATRRKLREAEARKASEGKSLAGGSLPISQVPEKVPEVSSISQTSLEQISAIAVVDREKVEAIKSKNAIISALAKTPIHNKVKVETSTPTQILTLKERLKRLSERESQRVSLNSSKLSKEEVQCKVEIIGDSHKFQSSNSSNDSSVSVGMHGEVITYNTEQQEFIDTVVKGSCVLIGAAGTGKTTCSKGGMQALINSGTVPILASDGHTHLKDGAPAILIISYTRRAVNNIRKVQSDDLKDNCLTSHKLLEYAPVIFEIDDPETGGTKKTMNFLPSRNATNPLPDTIHTIVVEEASMLSVELYEEICSALLHEVRWVFIGDIQQLPPVFGSAILGFKMLELPVIQLTQVYRQALESPIIRLAHRILSGKPIPVEEYPEWHVENALTIHPWKKRLGEDNALKTLGAYKLQPNGTYTKGFFIKAIDAGVYDPNTDMILIPYNKSVGTIEINRQIANYIARTAQEMTYEVIAGYNKTYLSVGDKVLYDREDAEVVEIVPNPAYASIKPQPASRHLDYWGHNPKRAEERDYKTSDEEDNTFDMESIDLMLENISGDAEDRVCQASHRVTVKLTDTSTEIALTKSAEINSMLHSYALTVHKSQGSEWRKVFVVLHQSHGAMLSRELLYTAVTRAREELYVICESESFTKGIINQRIKGDTLEEKATFFQGKLDTRNQKIKR